MSSLWAGVSTRWYLILWFFESKLWESTSMWVLTLYGNGLTGTLELKSLEFTNWKKQIDCISKVVLCKCSIANSVSINFVWLWQELWQRLWWKTDEQGQFLVWAAHHWVELRNNQTKQIFLVIKYLQNNYNNICLVCNCFANICQIFVKYLEVNKKYVLLKVLLNFVKEKQLYCNRVCLTRFFDVLKSNWLKKIF